MGEHLPCKQGVKSSNLSISTHRKMELNSLPVMIACKSLYVMMTGKTVKQMYLENRIQKLISRVKDRELIDVC